MTDTSAPPLLTDADPEATADAAAEVPDPGVAFTVETSPAVIEPGGEIVFTVLIAAEDAGSLTHATAVFCLASGEPFGQVRLTDAPAGMLRSEPVERVAPDDPGPHVYTVHLVGPDDTLLGSRDVTVTVAAHPVALTVWDVPPVLEPGAPFRVTLGLKCPCGCASLGWPWRVRDATGRVVAEGVTGAEPWPGTAGLSWAAVELAAPPDTGDHGWTVEALAPEGEVPHASRALPLHLHVRPAPDVTLRVRAVDVATGKPVPRARVVAHPYRTLTGEDGTAELRLPRGRYTVFVSGPPYFAYKTQGELTADLDVVAEMHVDREFTDADAWA